MCVEGSRLQLTRKLICLVAVVNLLIFCPATDPLISSRTYACVSVRIQSHKISN